jgi:hypothetical protein
MGASGWHYLVPYQDDVAQALEELRHAVYNSGDFYREEPDATHALTEEQFIAQLDPAGDALGINEFLLDQWREAQQRARNLGRSTRFLVLGRRFSTAGWFARRRGAPTATRGAQARGVRGPPRE